MPELERLRADHAAAVLAFESANRAYFASSISDRGDGYFETFAERHRALLAEQDAGAQQVTGRGVATAAVRDLCLLASTEHGVRTFRAAASHENVASQRVLLKAGFVEVGPAEPSDIGGKQGSWFQRDALSPSDQPRVVHAHRDLDAVGDAELVEQP